MSQLFKQFSDNASFKKWLADTVFWLAYEARPVADTGPSINMAVD